MEPYFRYWGKARRKGKEGVPYHLLPYHCLDVAAVGQSYLHHHAALTTDWAARLHIDEKALADWLAFFLAMHDLGKFSYRFQGLRPDLTAELGNAQRPAPDPG
ncbi:MAG: CRISPR-associated helicase/endonuclease Cas3, partial [Methylococcaceae bacterium]